MTGAPFSPQMLRNLLPAFSLAVLLVAIFWLQPRGPPQRSPGVARRLLGLDPVSSGTKGARSAHKLLRQLDARRRIGPSTQPC